MRYLGLDVGRDFAHVAVLDGRGAARRLPRVPMGDPFREFAAAIGPDDVVALEASTNTWALAELLGRHAGRVVVFDPLTRHDPLSGTARRPPCPGQCASWWRGGHRGDARKLAVITWHLLTEDQDYREARSDRVHQKHRTLDRPAGRGGSGTRPLQRGATGSSHDLGRTRLPGGDDPHHPTLRQAVDRVHLEDTSGRPPGPGA